jgi:hypothetical protein
VFAGVISCFCIWDSPGESQEIITEIVVRRWKQAIWEDYYRTYW